MSIPFVPAKYFTSGRLKAIRLLVIHDMESAEKGDTAEAVARYFQTTTRQASAHYNIDNNSVVQSVRDVDTAWAAKNANADGLHFEHAGYASQTRGDWTDKYSRAMLAVSAKLVAKKCRQYGIPIKHLTWQEIEAGEKGIAGHNDVTEWCQKTGRTQSGHYDPGANFPWDVYIAMVKAETAALDKKPYRKSKIASIAAALAVAVGVFAGITQVNDPTPAPKPSPSPTASPTATPKPTPKPTTTKPTPTSTAKLRYAYPGSYIKVGSTNGTAVKRVQTRLKALGYYKGSIDGGFGPITKAAVTAFQKKRWPNDKKQWDGIVGKATWTALFTY